MSLECARRFGENLVHSRKRAGLSQEELGARANLHRTAIGLLERGARMPRVDTLIKLAAGQTSTRATCSTGWSGSQAPRRRGGSSTRR